MIAGAFQLAYVTSDLNIGLEVLENAFGVKNISLVRGVRHGSHCVADVALAWRGNVMLELVHVIESNGTSVYDQVRIPVGAALQLHHLGFIVESSDEWTALSNRNTNGGRSVFAARSSEKFKALYLDDRRSLGHFSEYIYCTPEGWDFLVNVAKN